MTTALIELLDRRADVIRSGATPEEISALTEQLRAALPAEGLWVRRLTLEDPPALLARLAAAEPVHPVIDDADMADRMDRDRRVFVLEHRALPGRPLNIVFCALWSGIASDLSAILDPAAPCTQPDEQDTAVFYSIWSVERGAVGLSGGRTLLTGAVAELSGELPALHTFVTLSPVPGLRRWASSSGTAGPDATRAASLGAEYLSSFGPDSRLLDPVARFHMGNGASLHRLAPDADSAATARDQSWGLMANYRYAPEDLEANRRALRRGEPVIGESVAELLRGH